MFSIPLEVRDYELDAQGIVNNAVYQNYFEHCRHKFLSSKNINFVQLAKENIHLVVTQIAINFKTPLVSNDIFEVQIEVEKSSLLKLTFNQKIIRCSDNKTIATCKVTGACVKNGRPVALDTINNLQLLFETS